MKKIIIFGSSWHSRVVLSEILKKKNYKVLGFSDKFKKKGKLIIKYNKKKYYNLGDVEDIKNLKNVCGVIGIGPNYIRKKIVEEVKKKIKNFKWETIISNKAIVDSNVKIGDGSVIISKCIINIGTNIGKHCLINTACIVEHDNIIKDYSSLGPGVITAGNIKVGKLSHIGVGSIMKEKVIIGDNVVVGAGSLIVKNCISNYLYFGSPAKKIKKRNLKDQY